MRIITKRTLIKMYEKKIDSKNQLILWHQKIKNNSFKNCNQVQHQFKDAECIGNGRVIFNICKNKYRLVAHFKYKYEMVYICFIGTHKEYDAIDPKTVWQH